MRRRPLLLMIALALLLLGVLPALAQQRPLFDPQTGAINPNGAWGNQVQRPYTPPPPRSGGDLCVGLLASLAPLLVDVHDPVGDQSQEVASCKFPTS